MRTNKRKLMSLLLTFVMLLSLLPTTALAEEESHPDGVSVTINGNGFTLQNNQYATSSSTTASSGYSGSETYVARYDGTSGTLYLNGYTGGAISATNGSLSIVLDGENTVTVNGGNSNFYGINGNGVALTIQGSGSLTVNATGTGSGSVYGIGGKSVAIAESANVTVNAKTEKTATYAIYAQNSFSTADSGALNLTVEGKEGNGQALYGIYVENGDISLDGSGAKSITMQGVGGMVYGIHTKTSGKITVTGGGSLTLKDETSKVSTTAIAAEGVVTLNAPVTIEKFKYGVYNSAAALTGSDTADIKITGGSYTFSDGKDDSYGLWSSNNRVAISGGTVNINTKDSAIVAKKGGLDVTGSPTVTLNTEAKNAFYTENTSDKNTIDLTSGGSVTATSKGTGLVYPIQGAITLGENTKVVKGTQYTEGTVSGAETAAGSGTYTVEFAYEAPGAASATVGDVTIEGTTGEEITAKEVTVTLTDAKFASSLSGNWITNLPDGLSQSVTRTDDTHAKITVSGTPTAHSVAPLEIKIPAENLVTSTSDLTVTTNTNAKFEILTLINEATATVTPPVAGQTPATTATPGDAAKYKVSVTKWTTSGGTALTSTDTFSDGDRYAVEVKFEPAAGYKFADGCTYKINGSNATSGLTAAWVYLRASAAPTASISLKLVGTDDGTTNYSFTSETPLTVTVTNSGTVATGALTIALEYTGTEAFTVSPNSITNVAKSGGTATFTVQPKTGLTAGTYTATVKVSGTGAGVEERSFTVNYTSSGTTTSIAVPTANTGLVYDGTEKIGVNEGTGYTLTGTYKATDVGASDYTATATLNSGYKWNDDTTDAKTISWNIGKRTPTADDFTFTPPTGLVYDGSEKTASITLRSPLTRTGTITPTYMKGSSEASSTKDAGEYTVKIDVAAGDNFNEASDLTNDAWKFSITPANQDAPTGLGVAAPTVSDGKGKITGTTDKMEYSTDNSFTSPAGTTCTDTATEVEPGTYYVRLKADSNHNEGAVANVTVPDFGVTPTYSVTITAGTGMTLASGNASQTGLTSAMTDVVYTANTGYYFPTDYSSAGTTSGVTVTRNSYTQITVSGTPTANVNITLAGATAKAKETTPTAAFTAESENGGKLSGVDTGMKYSVDSGSTWSNVTGDNMPITNVTTANGIQVKKPAADTNTKLDSDVQTISVSKAIAPVGVTAVSCTTGSNNNGKLQNVTAEMEYQKSGAATWTDCGGAEVTNLTNGTYYVRVKALDAVLASDNLSVEIAAYVAPAVYTITFNGNGGTPSVGTMTTTGGKLASLPTATRTGSYSFDGWYTAASGGTKITTAYVFSANTTVYAHWTYTGGGGGSYTPSYTVSVDKSENGTITVSPKSASKGDIVTITVKPDKGYELDTLKVLDKNGDTVKLTEKNGKYTFTMPAGKVTVKGSFEEEAPEQIFADVPVDAYYYEAVKWAAEKGITGGIGNDLFAPNQPCTRAQIVTFLWRAAGSPEPKTVSSFADVTAGSYYAKAVAWAVENGITSGTGDGKFSPDATCTRAQAVTFLYRALSAKAEGKAEFSDVPVDSFFAEAVAWAAANGITTGVGGGKFAPTDGCTRAQIVTFLYRTYQSK